MQRLFSNSYVITDMLIGDEDEDGENEGNDLAAIFDEEVRGRTWQSYLL